MIRPIFLLAITVFAVSCSGNDKAAPKFRVECSDSTLQEVFDEHGSPYMMSVPGKCDTIYLD